MLSPDDAYRLNTQIRTFELRFRRQCTNAKELCTLLSGHQAINKIWYPGLAGHPTHTEAVKLFGDRGFGGMITFDFGGNNDPEKKYRRDKFITAVSEKIKLIPSLGDPKTILMPVESVWGAKYPEPGMIRMSAGFEETDDILKTVREGLNSVI
jgi:cystathionine beta-lyase/cystathionine gamma-synthase